jgi:hypothetical protein
MKVAGGADAFVSDSSGSCHGFPETGPEQLPYWTSRKDFRKLGGYSYPKDSKKYNLSDEKQ